MSMSIQLLCSKTTEQNRTDFVSCPITKRNLHSDRITSIPLSTNLHVSHAFMRAVCKVYVRVLGFFPSDNTPLWLTNTDFPTTFA